jgi:hypothetical protein
MPAAATAACFAMFNMLFFSCKKPIFLRRGFPLSRCLFIQRRSVGFSALRQIASEVQLTTRHADYCEVFMITCIVRLSRSGAGHHLGHQGAAPR